MKKVLSILLALIVVASTFVTALAADPTITVSTVEADPGETVDLDITVANNPGFINVQLEVSYDSKLTLSKYTVGVFPDDSTEKDYTKNPYIVAVGDSGATENFTSDGKIATLTFVVPNDATPGSTLAVTAVSTENTMDADFGTPEFSMVAGGITVKGVPAPTTYTVTYNANGGTTDATPATVEANGAADLNKEASKEGYTFLGWNTDKDATTALDSYTVTGDVILYAIYEENPTSLLEGIYTRLAKNVTIDYKNKTINLVYDTAQRVFQSTYVGFAPKVADGVTVKYSSKDAFISDHARLTNYTETASSATNIDLAAEKATSKSAIVGNAIQKAQGSFNFTMHLENVSEEVTEDYQVIVQLNDASTEVVGLVANSDITTEDFKTFRESDEVAIDTSTKVITLTTKNMYNYTTIAIDATKIGENAIATNAARPHRAMQLVNADENARYMDFANVELANKYSSAVLVNYVNGEPRSYRVRIYGGSDGTSYEEYTLTVVYAPSLNVEKDIKIGRIHNIANAIGNSVADINETGTIQITYDPTKPKIVFSPIYARGYNPTISGDEGKVITELQSNLAGFDRNVYTIETGNIPSALKYNVRLIRDTRVYAFEFINKNN